MNTSFTVRAALGRVAWLLAAPFALAVSASAQPIYTANVNSQNWSAAGAWSGTAAGVGVAGAIITKTASGSANLTLDIPLTTFGTFRLEQGGGFQLNLGNNAVNLSGSGGAAAEILNVGGSAANARVYWYSGGSSTASTVNLLSDLKITNTNTNHTANSGSILLSNIVLQGTGTTNLTLSNVNNSTSTGQIRLEYSPSEAGTSSFNGAVAVLKGAVSFNFGTAFGGKKSNTLTLGSAGGGSTTLFQNRQSGIVTVANDIIVAAGTGGTTVLGGISSTTNTPITTYAGDVMLQGDLTTVASNPNATGGATVNFTGTMAGVGNLTITGNTGGSGIAATQLRGNGTFTGTTRLESGTLRLGAMSGTEARSLEYSTVDLRGGDTGTLQFGYTSVSGSVVTTHTISSARFGGLTGSRGMSLQNIDAIPGAVALSVGYNNQSTQYDGVLSGAGALTKVGTGTLTLTAAQTHTGGTHVEQGTLRLTATGSLAANTDVVIDVDGTLTGSGSVLGSLVVNGTIAPGNGPGSMNIGDLTLGSGGRFIFDVASNGLTGTAGTTWDQLVVDDTLDLTRLDAGSPFVIDLTSFATPTTPGALASFDPASTYIWSSIITFNNLEGTFSSDLFTVDSSAFQHAFGNHDYGFSVVLNGDSLDLTYGAIPEPSTYAVLFGLFVLVGTICVRRRSC